MTEDLSRRRLFGLAGATVAGAAGLGMAGCGVLSPSRPKPTLATTTADASAGFVSRPDLTPPEITVRQYGLGADSKYLFLNCPYSGPGHGGTIILDPQGQLVWFGPNTKSEHRMDFDVQSYQGKPVLTWWQGLVTEGYGRGEGAIANSSYEIIKTVRTVGGVEADLHEFNITPQGTALLTAYRTIPNVDLSDVHGPSSGGYLLSGVAQEIDIETGELVFEWDSWKSGDVPLWETYETLGPGDGGYGTAARPFNYFHINSIAAYDDEHLLISGRNTWTVYLVSKATGHVVWRMNGKKSSFDMDPAARFYWQHHVRPHAGNLMTVFDNGASPAEETHSRALVLQVDVAKKQVALHKQYIHPGEVLLAGAMGSAQLLSDGMFVGWGTCPNFSQFDYTGRLLLDGTIAKGAASYRAFTQNWTGLPTDLPAVAVRHPSSGSGAIVYASWNGATGIASWAVYAGETAKSVKEVGTARSSGFETAITVSNSGPWFAAAALDRAGHTMARSEPVKIGS